MTDWAGGGWSRGGQWGLEACKAGGGGVVVRVQVLIGLTWLGKGTEEGTVSEIQEAGGPGLAKNAGLKWASGR